MREFFLNILQASFHGSILILVVLALRMLLKRGPRNAICLLWLLAAVRLICPVTIESSLSLQPNINQSIRVESDLVQQTVTPNPQTPSDALGNTEGWPDDVVISTGDAFAGPDAVVPEAPVERDWLAGLAWVWLAGVLMLLLYTIISYVNLWRSVRDGIRLERGVYCRCGLDTAFVLGIINPRIYLPENLDGDVQRYVIVHERTHIARRDHIWKLLGFAVLAVHWFNPLVWLAYSLYCKDLEMACDERVVRSMDTAQRKAYSMALVACAAKGHTFGACPVAFGEIDVKGRVKAVLNYKKPGFWIGIIAVVAIIAVAVCFLTSPGMTDEEILDNFYAEMEELQNRGNVHLLVTEELETENPYLLDRQQEYWISGDDWYGVYTYNFTQGRYEICVAQVDGIQKCCKRSDDFEVADNGIWQDVHESNYHNMAQLLTTDWTESTIMEIRRENGGYIVIVEGYHANERQYTTFENYYTFQMNHNGELVGVTRYDCSETIHKVFDLSGWYETETTYNYTFLEVDNAEFCELVNQAFGVTMSGVNDQEAEDLKLEQEEEERRRLEEELLNMTQTTEHPHDEHQDEHH